MTFPLGGNPLPVYNMRDEQAINTPDLLIGRTRPYPYTTVRTGELIVAVTAKQCPNIACDMIKFRTHPLNTGYIHIGWNASVSITDGTQDTSTGLILGPGSDSGWIPVTNMSLLFYIGSVAGDKITYMSIAP
jgi:hypothetical protein